MAFVVQCQTSDGAYDPTIISDVSNEDLDPLEDLSQTSLACNINELHTGIKAHLLQAGQLLQALEENDPADSTVQAALHHLLWNLFTEEQDTDLETAYFDYIPVQFLIGYCTAPNGKIKEPVSITPVLSQIQWMLRMVYFTHAIRTKDEFQSVNQ